MHTLSTNRYWRLGALFFSLLFLVLVEGCVRVNVSSTCPPGKGGGGVGDPPGACNKVSIVNPWNTDDNTYYASNGTLAGAGKQCISGNRCRTPSSSAGSCTLGGTNCKTWYWPSASDPNKGDCKCDCPDAYP